MIFEDAGVAAGMVEMEMSVDDEIDLVWVDAKAGERIDEGIAILDGVDGALLGDPISFRCLFRR